MKAYVGEILPHVRANKLVKAVEPPREFDLHLFSTETRIILTTH
jgi:hypothetical protein